MRHVDARTGPAALAIALAVSLVVFVPAVSSESPDPHATAPAASKQVMSSLVPQRLRTARVFHVAPGRLCNDRPR